ncbi:protein PHYTOCHROME KINASE SUBSTRATE 4-like [Gastrolobium bilobum]|uniref:protein PHYTOCHROME KINASE SUBSTRATE 4-like n=1 Tax=Gastrolobium bilobum TaxID=150636 RepID=UPI002AB0D842|nr:protein PHYTOCHROME KINASE SUBSTRATE 4-like [Gastrolobium bilobum]
MKTFHGNLTPKSPNLRDRDASFSSYLRPDKPITCQPHHHAIGSGIRRALEDSTSELSIFDAHKYFNEVTNNETQKVTITSNSRVSPMIHTDMERIPERGDIITETTRYSSASSSVDGYAIIRNYRARSFHAATPTASSEASWNSQAGLLSHPKGAIPVSMKNPPNPNELNKKNRTTFTSSSLSKPIWLLRRKCPCTGKKSVQVKENIQQSKTQTAQLSQPPPPSREPAINYSLNDIKRHDHESKDVPNHITPNNWVVNQTAASTTFVATKSQRFHPNGAVTSVKTPFTDGFTFPVLNPNPKPHIPNGVVEEDPPRDSLEVFQPPENTVEQKSRAGAGAVDVDDAASDASSDLFEIESFSTATQSTYPIMYRHGSRDSFDEASGATNNGFFFGRRSMDEGSTTTTAYEPSEASIEWSVTTAEAHEDYIGGGGGGGGVAAEKWKRKGGNGLLVSCRSEKAVSVGPQPVKCGTTPSMHVNHHVIVSGVGVNSNTSSSGSTRVIGCVNKPPLAKSNRNTPRVSLAFAT